MNINRASDLLETGESAIVLFTKGMYLVQINPDGSGSSGNWVTSPDHHPRPEKVIIYNRLSDKVPVQSEIYLANYDGAEQSSARGRLIIRFQDANYMGTTNQNWYEFADTGPYPVRYLRKR